MTTSSIQDILMMYVWEDGLDLTRREEIVPYVQKKLFNFDYPLYDEKLKHQFERDFIRHFYTREIGSESVALFKLRLEDYLYLNHEKWQRLYQNVDENVNPFTNVDIKTIRDINLEETKDNQTTDDDKITGRTDREETGKDTNKRTHSTKEDTDSTQDTNVTSHADDFTRNLEQTPPDERLSITANDGVGLIDYASNIQENKNINDSTQESETVGTTDRTTTGTDDSIRDNTTTGFETDSKNRLRTELENQKRALEQLYNEQKVGRTWNKSFVEVYNEYVNHFQGLHKLMFKDMEKLFLGVF